ncbi:ATP-dependent DNA helicase PIF1 [Elysia marginata]|uniref:ATP-dependent DNA helicase PIF1 n=1 Tax=Elysia marginata TaxID=1093978 RepID=A0AAV4HNY8_9GAST|nr:ATP-dependent DNA helicase PIF1 [Elysia marginata]
MTDKKNDDIKLVSDRGQRNTKATVIEKDIVKDVLIIESGAQRRVVKKMSSKAFKSHKTRKLHLAAFAGPDPAGVAPADVQYGYLTPPSWWPYLDHTLDLVRTKWDLPICATNQCTTGLQATPFRTGPTDFERFSDHAALCKRIKSFKTAIEVSAERFNVKIVLHAQKKTLQNGHARSYNLPTSSEIAALLPSGSTGNLDISLKCREGDGQELKRINTCHRSYDPLHYILMFLTGCDGWHLGLNRTDNKKLTAADFYKSRLQIRLEDFNIVFKGKKLNQQYVVDQWAKVEAGRLDWVRRNKKKTLRAENTKDLWTMIFMRLS